MGRLVIRAIGNSLGVIIPRTALRTWGLDAGDSLELDERGIRPPVRRSSTSHELLDTLKRRLAAAVVAGFTANQIRAQSLANLHRWKASGAWVSAYDEWLRILEGSDGELYATMLGTDERSNRLRQSPPYVGLLSREEVRRLNAEASA